MSRGVLFFDNPVANMPVMFLWPHSGCNARCRMCDIWQDRSRRKIDWADVDRWADEWQAMGVQFVILTGGEALMHPEIWGICESLKARGMDISLLSTGITLRRHAAEVARYCNGVTVSLDGPGTLHDEIRRVPRAHQLLTDGIAAVREHDPQFRFFGRCAVHRHNFHRLRDTVAFARDIGLDRISFLAADVTSEAFNRPEGWSPQRQDEIALRREDLPALAAELDALETEFAHEFQSGYINEPAPLLRERLLGYYTAHHGERDFPDIECNAPWGSALVEFDGTVRPCFFQPAYGNIHEAGSLQAVLNSPTAVQFRQNLDIRTDSTCRRCVCTFAIKRCTCSWSRTAPNCDNTCMLLDLLATAGSATGRNDDGS